MIKIITSNKLEVSWNGISSSGDWEYDERGGHVKVYTKALGNAGQVILEQWESNKSLSNILLYIINELFMI